MFKFAETFKNMLEIKKQMDKLQKSLKKIKVEAETGGGLVKVEANGQQEITRIKIDPELVEKKDVKLLEDLILSAVNEARKKAQKLAAEEMAKNMGNLPIDPKDVSSFFSS